MASPPVHHIDVRAFCYATEVPERVETALSTVYPIDSDDAVTLERSTTEGHYGHPIDILAFSLTKADQFRTAFDRLAERGDLEAIDAELDDRVTEECDLYLRFDKQRAYRDGHLQAGRGIELRIRLEAYPAKREAAIDNLRAYLEERREGR